MKSAILLFTVFSLCLAGCGKNGKDRGEGLVPQQQRSDQDFVSAAPGTYYTVLRPVNFRANGFIPYGMATFSLEQDRLEVRLSIDDDQPVRHRQALHIGTRCPTLADDTNGDGFIDYLEAMRVVGPVLMPLDSDINSQKGGAEVYPSGPAMTYSRQASLQRVNTDLWSIDDDPSDLIIKLTRGKGIGFDGRVVMVHGTTPQPFFPNSLSAHEGELAHLSLPIVCGLLKKTTPHEVR